MTEPCTLCGEDLPIVIAFDDGTVRVDIDGRAIQSIMTGEFYGFSDDQPTYWANIDARMLRLVADVHQTEWDSDDYAYLSWEFRTLEQPHNFRRTVTVRIDGRA